MDNPTLPNWTFEVEERSAGVYLARGRDQSDRTVECSGTDPDRAIADCREMASRVMPQPAPPNLSTIRTFQTPNG